MYKVNSFIKTGIFYKTLLKKKSTGLNKTPLCINPFGI